MSPAPGGGGSHPFGYVCGRQRLSQLRQRGCVGPSSRSDGEEGGREVTSLPPLSPRQLRARLCHPSLAAAAAAAARGWSPRCGVQLTAEPGAGGALGAGDARGVLVPPARWWATRLAPAPSTAPGAGGLCLLPFGVWRQERGPAGKGLRPVGSVVPWGCCSGDVLFSLLSAGLCWTGGMKRAANIRLL